MQTVSGLGEFAKGGIGESGEHRGSVPSFNTLQEAKVPVSAVILAGLGGLEAVVGGESGRVDG